MLCTEIQHMRSVDFLLEIMQVRRQWINIIKATERKKKTINLGFVSSEDIFHNQRQNK